MLGLGGQAEAVAPSAYPAGALAEPLRKAELPLPQAAARAELGGVGAETAEEAEVLNLLALLVQKCKY